LSFNVAHDLGGNNRGCPGPVGIWAWGSDNIVIKFNEVYRVQQITPPAVSGCDWAAYDFDEGVTNSIYEYNYSHDNGGAAILIYQPGGGNVFRYNVSENDDNQMLGGSGVYALGPYGPLSIYNNTIYRRGVFSSATPSCYSFSGYSPADIYPTGIVLANNLCIIPASGSVEGFARYIDVQNGTNINNVVIKNNLYYSPNAVWWINGRYDTLAQMQAAGWDQGSIVAAASPVVNAGAGGTCSWSPPLANGPQPCPTVYHLNGGAPGVGAGLNLTVAPYNFNVGTRDYWGATIPHATGTGYNMGADGAVH
jgi:Right handed beta helix region